MNLPEGSDPFPCELLNRGSARVRGAAELLFDAEQLVVPRDAIAARTDPVLICPADVPTARSAIVVSSVSPER